MNWVAAFGLCAITSESFDGTEIAFLISLLPALLAIEAAVYVSSPNNERGRAGCGSVATIALIAVLFCACWPRRAVVVIYPDTYASIAAVRFK